MLVALTGASGFVGSYTAKALHSAGHDVRALVRSSSRRDHIAPFVAEWREGEIYDSQSLAGLVAGVDAVIHVGVDWEAVRTSPVHNVQRNLAATLELLELSRVSGVQQFMFVSSGAVYAEILPGGRIDETHPTWPGSEYGAYKAAVEPFLKVYHAQAGMNTSSWRPVAIYGVDPNLARSQWHDLIQSARDGGTIDTAHGGKITHVHDVADALTLALGDASVAGEFFNLVDGYMYWQHAAEFAKEITGSSATIIDRKGTGPKNQFDCAKAIAFFDRHGNSVALRRGTAGVREYVADLLKAMP